MASLSNSEQTYLSPEEQESIKKYKQQYAQAQAAYQAATDDAARKQYEQAMKDAHTGAENVRKNAGFSGGTAGNESISLATTQGGKTPEQVRQYLDDYNAANYSKKNGWVNGYDVDTNVRSKANFVRQQMDANSKAWHTAKTQEEKDALHAANVALADILAEYTGHSTAGTRDKNGNPLSGASYGYDESTGKWWTWDANNGYGEYVGYNQPNIRSSMKEHYGYTDQEMDDWSKNRSSLYYNFVDARTPARNQVDESSGFTGRYAQFVNGPHLAILGRGTNNANMASYSDLVGDGFNDDKDYAAYILPEYDADGDIKKTAPALKNNNGVSDYTKQFAAYTQNGLIMPNSLQVTNPGSAKAANGAYTGALRQTGTGGLQDDMSNYVSNVNDGNDLEGQLAYADLVRKNTGLSPNGVSAGKSTGGSGGLTSYLEQMYDAALKSELSGLETSYNQNISELDASAQKTAKQYTEQRRQTAGQSAMDAAAWREMANAYGLNTGAIGQANLAQSNQLQSDLNTLTAAEATAQDEIERNRVLLGQQYQAAINEAIANNDQQKAQALYQEAVRMQEQLVAQQQFYAQMALQQAQLAMQQSQWEAEFAAANAKSSGGSGGGGYSSNQVVLAEPDYVRLSQMYRDAGNSASPENYIATHYGDYGFDKSSGLSAGYDAWAKNRPNQDALDTIISHPSLTTEYKQNQVWNAYDQGRITKAQREELLYYLGV